MRARQVSEEEAFAVLRAASMHSNRRVGQVSQQVIAAAHYADAVNRAGKLRMLSQRLVKACALRLLDRGAAASVARSTSRRQIDANIAALAKSLSQADLRRPARRRRGGLGRGADARRHPRSAPAGWRRSTKPPSACSRAPSS